MMDAEGLLRDYPKFCNQLKTLEALFSEAKELLGLDDDALIEQFALGRKPPDGLPIAEGGAGSKTEGLALKLDALRAANKSDAQNALLTWTNEREILRLNITLYQALVAEMTQKELTVIELHLQQGYSLRGLARGEAPIGRSAPAMSLYELRRTKKRLLEKAERLLNTGYSP